MKKFPTIAEMRKSLTKEQLKAIKEEAHRQATLMAIEETKDLNEDQLRVQLVELKAQLREAQRQRDLLKNAFFVAHSENLPIADFLMRYRRGFN